MGSEMCIRDSYREGDDYTVAVDLPGVDPASIDIDVDDRTLTIRAERAAKVAKEAQWLSRERAMGTFARQLTLGHGLATDRITAEYTDGVLTLTIPVAETAKPRKVEVRHGSTTIDAMTDQAQVGSGEHQEQ